MKITFILTTFSPALFGTKATCHIKLIDAATARSLVDEDTRIVATRISHERLARTLFPDAARETSRYANLKPDTNAILLHYRGPQVPDSGEMPLDAVVTYYLIETEQYQEHE